jgi:hypothetical protein
MAAGGIRVIEDGRVISWWLRGRIHRAENGFARLDPCKANWDLFTAYFRWISPFLISDGSVNFRASLMVLSSPLRPCRRLFNVFLWEFHGEHAEDKRCDSFSCYVSLKVYPLPEFMF